MRSPHPRALILVGSLFCTAFGWCASSEPAASSRLVTDERFQQLSAAQADRSADELLELGLAFDERHEPTRAADNYRLAGLQGVGAAELRLGALYEIGSGVPQDYAEARSHYERAVALGVPEANLRLGLLYLEGWGVKEDSAEAIAHIERAAQANYEPAQEILSQIYFVGIKVPRDLAKAAAWSERSAAKRDPSALIAMGAIKQAAVRRPEDMKLARDWYQLSAEQDYTRGMLAMASTFLRPGANAEDVRLGVRWLELAADGGNSTAAFHLAGALLLAPFDLGSDRIAAAEKRLQQSADAGELQAREVLELAKGGQPLQQAFIFVVSVPFEERHVQRIAADPKYAEDKNGNQLPRPLKIVRPVYPAALLLSRTEGEATVEFIIDTTGRVRDAKVIKATHPGFGDSAVSAMLASRFQPAKRNHRLVNTRVQQPVYFNLSYLSTAGDSKNGQAGNPK